MGWHRVECARSDRSLLRLGYNLSEFSFARGFVKNWRLDFSILSIITGFNFFIVVRGWHKCLFLCIEVDEAIVLFFLPIATILLLLKQLESLAIIGTDLILFHSEGVVETSACQDHLFDRR